MKKTQKMISGLLALCMVLSMLPIQTFAQETEALTTDETTTKVLQDPGTNCEHIYTDGICSVCGSENPDYAAAEPGETVPGTTAAENASADVVASGTFGENLTWVLDSNGLLTISGSGAMTDYDFYTDVPWYELRTSILSVSLPSGLTSIGEDAFRDCSNLTAITIPDSVTSISHGAFYNCSSLSSINIPDGVASIGEIAFGECNSLAAVTIPDSVTSIGLMAFYNCTSLTVITIPSSVSSIGYGAFAYCLNLAEITVDPQNAFYTTDSAGLLYTKDYTTLLWCPTGLDSCTIPASVSRIDNYAFFYCSSLTEVILQEGVTVIGSDAFQACSALRSITIPASVSYIGVRAFMGCGSLKEIFFRGDAPNVGYGGNAPFDFIVATAYYPAGNETWTEEVMQEYGGQYITWKSYCEHVWDDGTVTREPTVIETGVRTYTCTICSETKTEEIPVLEHAHEYSAVVIDPTCTEQGYTTHTCSICSNSHNDTFVDATGHSYTDGVCHSCGAVTADITSIAGGTYGENVSWILTDEGRFIISGKGEIKSQNHADNFPWHEYRDQIAEVIIPETITTIGDRAFVDCTALSNLIIGDGVNVIGGYAFFGCTNLNNLSIPNSVTSINTSAFTNCTSLTNVAIPDSVAFLGSYAFERCEKLSSVTIGSGLATVGARPFGICKSLTGIWVDAENASFFNDDCGVLLGKENATLIQAPIGAMNGTFTIPSGVAMIADGAFMGCRNLTGVEIPNSVTTIGPIAFAECENLARLVIPEGVTTVQVNAFRGCTNLSSLTIPASLASLDRTGYTQCPNLTGVWVDSENPNYTNDENGVLYNKEKTELFFVPRSLESFTIPEGITAINSEAFANCSRLIEVVIPNSVTTIGNYAFSGCTSLKDIVFEGDAPSIGENAFVYVTANAHRPADNTTWTSDVMKNYGGTITWVGGVGGICGDNLTWTLTEDGILTISGNGPMAKFDSLGSIPWLEYRNQIITVNIGAGCTSIEASAFQGCEQLTGIWVDENNPNYSNDAFGFLYNKEKTELVHCPAGSVPSEYTIRDGVTTVGGFAFAYCKSLMSITLPSSVSTIGIGAFGECICLTEIHFEGDAPSIGEQAFYCVSAVATYPEDNATWTENVMQQYGGYILWSPNKTLAAVSGTLGENLTWELTADGTLIISGDGAMPNFGEVLMPWFDYRAYIRSVKILPGVTSIGDYSFVESVNLSNVELPESLTAIGNYAFTLCPLASITIPNSVVTIGDYAFAESRVMTSVTIPASVTSIGKGAFGTSAEFISLEDIYFEGDAPILGEDMLYHVIATAHYPADNATWTKNNMLQYGGRITWKAYTRYDIIEDGTQTEVIEGEALSVRIDTEFTEETVDEIEVYMNNELVDKENYTVTEGSVIITFKPQYLATLDKGTHTVSVVFPNGRAASTIIVPDDADNEPVCIHANKTEVPAQLPDCINDGNHLYYVCECGAVFAADGTETTAEAEIILALGHTHESVVTVPTCTDQGYTTHTCFCGDTYMDSYVDAIGHTYDDGVVTTEPGCTTEGITTFTCLNDESHTYTEVISAKGHTFENGNCTECGEKDPDYTEPTEPETEPTVPVKPNFSSWLEMLLGSWWGSQNKCNHSYTSVVTVPTCTDKGYTTHTCSKCGNSYKNTYTDALGHTWDEGVITQKPTCTKDGTKTYTCGICSHQKAMTIKATGHDYENGICSDCGAEKPTNPSKPEKPSKPGWSNMWDWILGCWWK